MNKIKKFYPIFFLIIFCSFIYYYYQKNLDDFQILKRIDFKIFIQIVFLSFFYLITEGLILKNIVTTLKKKMSLVESFFVMNFTYFCNTFIQFTGLGYRVYYINKKKNIKVSRFIKLSLDTISCEVFIFSLIGIFSLVFIDFSSQKINISEYIYISFLLFLILSIIYLLFLVKITKKLKEILNYFKFYKLDKLFNFFLIVEESKKKFYLRQSLVFLIQYIILFSIFFIILKKLEVNNSLFISLITTSLVDFSFLMAFTPYSVGITEFITLLGTKDIPLTFVEIILLINIFRISMLIIYFILGPAFVLFNLVFKKNGM